MTAGPTYEAIDPVRFIGNRSTGKMGYAIAETLAEEGAKVILISGPVELKAINKNIQVVPVVDADEMNKESCKYFSSSDGAILSAAVADYKPESISHKKIKSKENNLFLKLTPTTDIASELGKMKKKSQFLIGFALETHDELLHAKEKLIKKDFDFIVINSLKDKGAGFGFDTNKISILDKNNKLTNFKLKSKKETAQDIVDKLKEIL